MIKAVPGALTRRVQSLSPRAAVLIGGALMVVAQLLLLVMLLAGAPLPSLDVSALLVVPVLVAGIVLLWAGPVVVAVASGQAGWLGVGAVPGGFVVWVVGTLLSDALPDAALLAAVEAALPVMCFAGALAAVGGAGVWRRLAGVAVIAALAALAGAAGDLLQGVSPLNAVRGVGFVGLVVAVGFLVWVAPRTPPRVSGSPAAS